MQLRFIGSFAWASVNYKQTRVAHAAMHGSSKRGQSFSWRQKKVNNLRRVRNEIYATDTGPCLTAFTAHCTDKAA
jgi:hypothetical protein